jgi:hypothetical protein
MSTRAQVRFATREVGVSFNEHPDKIHAQFYVHHDGYPEGLGLQIAISLSEQSSATSFYGEIEELQTQHGDLDYIYYVWQKYDDSTWISIFKTNTWFITKDEECIFVGTPESLIKKYKLNTNEDG